MARPTTYDRQNSFRLYSAENPGEPQSGTDLDTEFDTVKISLDETQANLALVQDSDGAVARGSIGRAQLDSSITLGVAPPALWVTATAYDADVDVVFNALKLYLCLTDHTSGTFATDLASGYWLLLADFSATAQIDDLSISTAKLADGAVTAAKIGSNAVTTVKIINAAVTTDKIADVNVTTAKIADLNVTTGKIADLGVTTGKIADANVTTAKIADANVTPAKLATNVLSHAVGMINGTLVATVAASVLTIAIKTLAGADPSASDPVTVFFRNVTAATGDYTSIDLTAATSFVVSSGSTLGSINSAAFRLWVVGFNDAGTFRLGAINARSGVNLYSLQARGIASSTAEGGAGAADAAQTFYTGLAVTSKAYTVLGYLTWESGLAAAGTWSAGPTNINLFGVGSSLPGRLVQTVRTDFTEVATGTTTIPSDDSIPQNTEGDEYMTRAVTPSSAANMLRVEAQASLSNGASVQILAALFQDSTADALAAVKQNAPGTAQVVECRLAHVRIAGTTSVTTFKMRGGAAGAGTTTFNGESTGRLFGGVMNSFMAVDEIMA